VCFRKREVKSLRKGRRGDALASEKLKKLKEDLSRVKEILDNIYQREVAKSDLLMCDRMIFEKRVHVRRIRKTQGSTSTELDQSPEKPKKRIRRIFREESYFISCSDSTKIRIPMQKLRDAANMVSDMDNLFYENADGEEGVTIEDKIKRMKLLDEKTGWLDETEVHWLT
jgi:hypothetical protein